MIKPTLILLAGSPATGKSHLVTLLGQLLPQMTVLTPDDLKETLADKYGFDNLEAKAKLEIKVWDYYYQLLDLYMAMGKKVIVSEYPFSDKQRFDLNYYATSHNYQIITICLDADFEVLWQRRQARDRQSTRHLSHIVSAYHYGDQMADRQQADNHISREAFAQIIQDRAYPDFSLGTTFRVDVTDFSRVDYDGLLRQVLDLVEDQASQ